MTILQSNLKSLPEDIKNEDEESDEADADYQFFLANESINYT